MASRGDPLLKQARSHLKRYEKLGEAESLLKQALSIFLDAKDYNRVSETLRCLGVTLMSSPDRNRTMDVVDAELSTMRSLKDRIGEALVLRMKADILSGPDQGQAMVEYGQQAKVIFQENGDKDNLSDVFCLLSQGQIYLDRSDEALHSAQEALRIAETSSDRRTLANAWRAVMLARSAKHTRNALEAGSKATQLFKDLGDIEGEAGVLSTMTQTRLDIGDFQEAATFGVASYNLYLQAGDLRTGMESLRLAVNAQLKSDEPRKAVLIAEKELCKFMRQKDKRAETLLLPILVRAHAESGDRATGLKKAQRSLPLFKQVEDRVGLGGMLNNIAELQLRIGESGKAEQNVNTALDIFKQLKDSKGEEMSLCILDQICVQRGDPDSAPNRTRSLIVLRELARTLEYRDVRAFKEACSDFSKLAGFTHDEIDEIFTPVAESNPEETKRFIETHAGDKLERITAFNNLRRNKNQKKSRKVQVTHEDIYCGFRSGGLGYGPSFRCNKVAFANVNQGLAISALRISSEAENWEGELMLHPGLLDGTLHTGMALGIASSNQGLTSSV